MFYRTILILFVFSSISTFGQSYYSVHGWDVEARVDTAHGYFGIGQYSTGENLTYEFTPPLLETSPSSNLVLRIDGVTYGWDGIVSMADVDLDSFFNADSSMFIAADNTIRNRWDIPLDSTNTIQVDQFFTPVENRSKGMIEVRYIIRNNSLENHSVALEHKWDIKVNDRDDALIFFPESDSTNRVWADFIAIPEWIATSEGASPMGAGLTAEIGLKILDATPPDFVAYGNEAILVPSCFSVTPAFAGPLYSYSGALIRWNERLVTPGGSIEIISYYGIGGDFFVRDLDIGWNLFSLPCTTSMTASLAYSLGEYGFDNPAGAYYITSILEPGVGYWGLISDTTYAVMCAGLDSYSDTVYTGWNLIGAVDHAISRGAISTTPPGIMLDLFGWSPSTMMYFPTDSLYPGHGYWLLSSGDGTITVGP